MATVTTRNAEVGPGVRAAGLLLAAGAGRRMGTPKGLLRHPDGTPWVAAAADALLRGGCAEVRVVVGARGPEVAALLPADARVRAVTAPDWAEGMGASLRAGLSALAASEGSGAAGAVEVAVVHVVDTPDVGAECVARLLAAADGPATLARARFDGRGGHPVVLGADHWAAIVAQARGDVGARDYLRARQVTAVDCGDLAGGRDIDTRADLAAGVTTGADEAPPHRAPGSAGRA